MLKNLLLGAVVAMAVCGCSTLRPVSSNGQLAGEQKKVVARDNAASLLADLLKDESNVDKVLIVKSAGPDVKDLIKLIAATSATHERELQLMATNDPAINLQSLNLPPGEAAAREGTTKSKEYDMLLSTGANFEFNLLFSQAQAENYGWHLAQVAADNSTKPEEAHTFSTIADTMKRLYGQAIEQLRATPAK